MWKFEKLSYDMFISLKNNLTDTMEIYDGKSLSRTELFTDV